MKTNILILISLFALKGFCQENATLFEHEGLTICNKSAHFKGKELYNAEEKLKQLVEAEKTEDCPVDYRFYYNPLSLVGTFYSYESGEGGTLACGVPSNSTGVQTINLSDRKPVSLSAIFLEDSILKALKEDAWIEKMQKESKTDFQSITSFEAFLTAMNGLGFATFKSNSFAIIDYNRDNGKVAVRFVAEEYMGYDHNKHLQLGLWLDPKESYAELFKNKIHFKVGDYKNGLKE